MTPSYPELPFPPIVEAVLDMDCDFPPTFQIEEAEHSAKQSLLEAYPRFRTRRVSDFSLRRASEHSTEATLSHAIDAFMFLSEDGKQIAQFRRQGFSFNRLAPYTHLSEYLPEIEKLWGNFRSTARPIRISSIRLRYINRILVPLSHDSVNLERFFTIAPQFSTTSALLISRFLHEYSVRDSSTNSEARIVLTNQASNHDTMPVIFDITTEHRADIDPSNWPGIAATIDILRDLKNRVFFQSVTDACQKLFQRPPSSPSAPAVRHQA